MAELFNIDEAVKHQHVKHWCGEKVINTADELSVN